MTQFTAAAGASAVSVAEVMTRLRDHLVAEAEIARAGRPADMPAPVPGFQPVPVPAALGEALAAFAEAYEPDDQVMLPPELAAATIAALDAEPHRQPGRARLDGVATGRAAEATGRARVLDQAHRLNDQQGAAGVVPLVEQLVAAPMLAPLHSLLRRAALQVMAEVERETARRERGIYPDRTVDPAMALVVASREVAPPPALAPPAAEASTAPPVPLLKPGKPVSQLMTAWIDHSKTSRRDETSEKTLLDRAVARDLFVEICGDLPINEVTTAVCEDFVEQLMAVPAMHGRGVFAGLSAREALELADRMDQEAELKRGADGRATTERRLAKGTINKHLSSLEGGLAKHMGLLAGASSPFVQARFAKKEVTASPSFVRRMPNDGLMRGMFHGPLFTGHDDSANRGAPGPHLEQDSKYWVPLVAALSGACLEEMLQMRPCDVHETEGICVIDIGADGAQVKTPLRPRLVPVHSALKKLGFLRYVEDCRRRGQALLFPGFLAAGPDARFGHTFTKFWTEYRRQCGHYARGADLHALRHSVNTRLLNAGVTETIIRHILGHAQQGMTAGVYNSGIGLQAAAAAIEKLRYDDCIDFDDLARRAVN